MADQRKEIEPILPHYLSSTPFSSFIRLNDIRKRHMFIPEMHRPGLKFHMDCTLRAVIIYGIA